MREWVKEHNRPIFHFYGSGHMAYAACGKKPIPGSPICVTTEDLKHYPNHKCPECSELHDIKDSFK